jgi:predicted dehydrogenase
MHAELVSESLNWGFVGTGDISDVVALEVLAAKSGRLVAVVSRDIARARAFADRHGFTRCYDDLAPMLADPEVDAIYVAVPHPLHAAVTLQAMDAGKHVLCEKPLATRSSDIQALLDHANSKKLIVVEGFMMRHHPQWAWIENCIKSGDIGTVQFVQSFFSFEQRPQNSMFDLMYDVGCYCIHASILAFGDTPTSVFAGTLSDSLICANVNFPAGIAQFAVSADTVNAGGIRILGSGGSIELLDPIRPPNGQARIQFKKNGSDPEYLVFGPALQFGLQFSNFAKSVKHNVPALVSLRDSMINARCIEAVLRSKRSLSEEIVG